MSGSVFISYSREDAPYVGRLVAHLRELGLQVWVDEAIERGTRFAEVLETQIHDCAAFVPVLTPASVSSRWVRREISFADDLRKPILPMLLVPCRRPLIVYDLDYEDVTGGQLPSAKFVATLRGKTGGVPGPPVAAHPRREFRRLASRVEDVARDNGTLVPLESLTQLVSREGADAVSPHEVQRLRVIVGELKATLTARQAEPAGRVWRARLGLYEDEARAAVRSLLGSLPEPLHQWVDGELNLTQPARRAILFVLEDDIGQWQADTLEPLARRFLGQHLPAGASDTEALIGRLAQQVGDELRGELRQSLPPFQASMWTKAAEFAESIRIPNGQELPRRARIRDAIVQVRADIATRSTGRLAALFADGIVDILLTADAAVPSTAEDLSELDRIDAALAPLA